MELRFKSCFQELSVKSLNVGRMCETVGYRHMALDPVLYRDGGESGPGWSVSVPGDQRFDRHHLWRLLWLLWGMCPNHF